MPLPMGKLDGGSSPGRNRVEHRRVFAPGLLGRPREKVAASMTFRLAR
jgi:hypothetical protein